MIAKASNLEAQNESGAIQVLENKPFENHLGKPGIYTHRLLHITRWMLFFLFAWHWLMPEIKQNSYCCLDNSPSGFRRSYQEKCCRQKKSHGISILRVKQVSYPKPPFSFCIDLDCLMWTFQFIPLGCVNSLTPCHNCLKPEDRIRDSNDRNCRDKTQSRFWTNGKCM